MTWMQGLGTWMGGMGGGLLLASVWGPDSREAALAAIPLLVASVGLNVLSVVLIVRQGMTPTHIEDIR